MSPPTLATPGRSVDRADGATTVLLVDDSDAFSTFAKAHLEERYAGIEVHTASNSEDALNHLRGTDVDCVVSDYLMPGMDGLELCKKVKREHPGMPFLLLTGRGDEAVASEAFSAGVDDYLRKDPLEGVPQDLTAHIRKHVEDSGDPWSYREVWRKAAAGLSIHDPTTGVFLDANDRFCEMLGTERGELIGAVLSDVLPSIEGRARDRFRAAVEEGPQRFTWRAPVREEDPLWVEVVLRALSVQGREVVVASVRDVSEHRRSEEAIRSLYEIISDRNLDFGGKVEALMQFGRRTLGTGFATLSRLEGDEYVFEYVQSPEDQIDPGTTVSIQETLCEEAVVSCQRLVVDDMLEANERTEGATLQLACYVGAPVYVDDEVRGTFCFYDVEARAHQFSDWEITLVDLMSRWISDALSRMEVHEQLERENERLEDFTGLVSHDLRNPVRVAHGHAQLLTKEIEHESLDFVLRALERSNEIIQDALTWARTGAAVTDTEPVYVGEVARGSWALIEHEGKTLDVRSQQAIEADDSRLRRLLENLFRNAVEHGGDHVTVGDLKNGFYVADDGPGFDGLEHDIFEVGRTTAGGGIGFGLAIAQEIAKAHGWSIEATHGGDGGARFEIRGVDVVPGA